MKEEATLTVTEEILPIGQEQVLSAWQTLQRYRAGKANLEKRVIENQQWYKLRHWECLRKTESQVEPVSGWLFNAIAGKHADAMDNFPMANVLPREASDKALAEVLSAILPVVLESSDFEAVYDRVWSSKLTGGTGIYGVFWDKDKNGIGDVTVVPVDVLSLFWESGITDIQRSKNVFHVELADNDLLLERYPELDGKLGGAARELSRYVYDDSVDTSGKSLVVDWYYKKRGKLHFCKFVGDTVLYASENDPQLAERGWYDHGQYPFVFDPMFRVEGSVCGFGCIDIGKSAQEYIDRSNRAVLQNLLANARPRYFIRGDGAVNEAEFADLSKDFIHVDGNLGADSVVPVRTSGLDQTYLAVINSKIQELKEVTGNRDVVSGGTTGGVTAASAIAAMQEAGSKLSRDGNKASYRAFRQVCLLIIELIRQFYSLPRCFRVLGPEGSYSFVNFSNQGLLPQHQGEALGVDLLWRTPLFDITVTAQKQSPYTKMSQNELALQFFGAGFFDPLRARQALACLDMMDFDRKDMVIAAVRNNALDPGAGLPIGTPVMPKAVPNPETKAMQTARLRAAEATAPR